MEKKGKQDMKFLFTCSQLLLVLLYAISAIADDQLRFEIESVNETRSKNDFFASTQIYLNISGEILSEYKGILPIEIIKAYTDKNTQLKEKTNRPAENIFSFVKIENSNKSRQQFSLTNPHRTDRKLYIEGEVSLYKPQESSIIELKDYNKLSLKRVSNEILEKNGIDILFFTKYEFQDFITNSEVYINKLRLNNVNIHDSLIEKYGIELTYVAENYRRFFHGDYWDIYILMSGNWQKVVNIEFLNKAGRVINSPSRSIGHGPGNLMVLLDYDNKLPSNGDIRVEIIQDGDITIYPFKVNSDLP